jgi:hypothetical protein
MDYLTEIALKNRETLKDKTNLTFIDIPFELIIVYLYCHYAKIFLKCSTTLFKLSLIGMFLSICLGSLDADYFFKVKGGNTTRQKNKKYRRGCVMFTKA